MQCCFSSACFQPILGNFNFLEHSESLQACKRTDLNFYILTGQDIVLSIGKRYAVVVRGSNPGGDILCTQPKRPEDQLSRCKIFIGFFLVLKRSKRVVDHPSYFNAEDKERIELFLYYLRVIS